MYFLAWSLVLCYWLKNKRFICSVLELEGEENEMTSQEQINIRKMQF